MEICKNYLDGVIWRVFPSILEQIKFQHRNFSSSDLKNYAFLLNEEIDTSIEDNPYWKIEGRTLIFNVEGILIPKLGIFDRFMGLESTNYLRTLFIDTVGKYFNDFDRIIMNYDSPGGVARGGDEFGHAILEAKRSGKEIISFSNGQMGSLAYYLGSIGKIVTTPTAIVGSIGSMISIYKNKSSETITFKRGDLKDVGNPDSPLNLKEMQFYNDFIEKDYKDFTEFVSENRNVPVQEVLDTESRWSTAKYDQWYIDEIVYNIEDLII